MINMNQKKKNIKGFKIEIIETPTQEGIDPNKINEPIIIPLARLFREGHPPGTLYPIIIEHDKGYFYFGTICIMEDRKIIFFPGLRNPLIVDYQKNISGILEHITCDERYSKSHVKCKDRNKKFSNLHIIKRDLYYYWFTIAINRLENLDQKNQGILTIRTPKSDSTRRKKEVSKSYKEGEVFFLSLRGIIFRDNNFLNFDFYFTDKINDDFSDIQLFSSIAEEIKNNKIKSNALIFEHKLISKRLLIICSILKKKNKDVISDKKPRFFFLQKK